MSPRLIIIGAGWSGVAAARTYLQINPSIDLTILDSDSSFGGVWSASRIYPGLVVDSPRGTYEFSDMTMCDDDAHPLYGDLPGEEVHSYFLRYARKWDLDRRTRFNVVVNSIERRSGERKGWTIVIDGGEVVECEKLIVAMGMFSKPYTPTNIDISNGFKGPIFHTRSLGTEYPRLQASQINNVVVIGGQKSAIETSLLCLQAGKRVHWIIREDGNGPAPIILKGVTEGKWGPFALSKTKLFAQLCPSIYNRTGWWYSTLHSGISKIGYGFTTWFWSKVKPPSPDYKANANTEKIRPFLDSFFWSTTPPAFLKKDSPFFKMLSEGSQLHVHRAEALSLADDTLYLSNGETIHVDALVFATGWQRSPASKIFSLKDCIDLGLPLPSDSEPPDSAERWHHLDREADKEIQAWFPILMTPPKVDEPIAESTPHRLFRHIVSPNLIADDDRSITFLSLAGTAHTVTYAEISALWAVAWMEGLHTPMKDKVGSVMGREEFKDGLEKEVARVNAFLRHRYLSSAKRTPAFITETQTVFDTLMRDLGLTVDRRRRDGGWSGSLREYLTPYENSDYNGIVQELLAKHKKTV